MQRWEGRIIYSPSYPVRLATNPLQPAGTHFPATEFLRMSDAFF